MHKERILRYRILRHEELPESHKKAYLELGINPDEMWSLIWSFNNLEDAEKVLKEYNEDPDKPIFWTYKMVDAGEESIMEISDWV